MEFPPGPTIEQNKILKLLMSNPFPFLCECRDTYGDIFTLNLGTFNINKYDANEHWVFLSNPDHLKIVFNADSECMKAGAANDIQFQQLTPPLGSVVIDGSEHIQRRRILSQMIVGQKNISRFSGMMHQITLNEIERLPRNKVFNLADTLRQISNQVMQSATFGEQADDITAHLNEQFNKFGEVGLTYEEKISIMGKCTDQLTQKIKHHKHCPISHSTQNDPSLFLSLLNTNKKPHQLTDDQIRDELIVILLGGADTTSTMMSWAMLWILSYPETLRKLQIEIYAAFGNKVLDGNLIETLPLLDAVIKETCRISPVLFNSSARLLTKPLVLGDYTIPKATILAHCTYLVHMKPDIYNNPESFKPERFYNIKPNPWHWTPFGGGIRRCIGMGFAIHEMKMVIATLLQNLKFEPEHLSSIPIMQGSFFGPKNGVQTRIVN